MADADRVFMDLAIQEARKCKPEDDRRHPLVGAVAAKDGRLLSSAHRSECAPGNHAEYTLVELKLHDESLAGATIYTTLEPCTRRNHPKVPCARRLIERKVARVVIGMLDPNPLISGKGQMMLRDAGITTDLFPPDLMAQIEDLNRDFIRSQKEAADTQAQRRESHWRRMLGDQSAEPSKNVYAYGIEYLPPCLDDLQRLTLSKEKLLALIQSEFRSHLNYFRFDLEDYIMPVKASYLVYFDKVGNHITFKRVLACTKNEAQLSSWSDILALYRRATRFVYRDNPDTLLTQRGHFGLVSDVHLDLEVRITKHFDSFGIPDVTGGPERIAFYFEEASRARREGYDIVKSLDDGIIAPGKALGDLVASLERSLQHIHKLLLLFPPVEGSKPPAPI